VTISNVALYRREGVDPLRCDIARARMQVFRKIPLKSERFPVHKCMVEYFVEEEKNIPKARERTATLPLILHRALTLCGKSFRSLVDLTYL
jgi:hypothetical protein